MKKFQFPNTYVIIFGIILICAVSTWFVGGNPQTWQVFSALFNGFAKQAEIIIFILIIGGAFWIVNQSKAIDVGIVSFLESIRRVETRPLFKRVGLNNVVIALIMVMFSIFGGVFGMSEETLAFIVIVVPLAISMGYDSITGLCMVYVAAHVGFAGAFLNPFNVGIAQKMAEIPMFSGMGYRLFCWIFLTSITIILVLIYARKVKKNPRLSPMYEADSYWRERTGENVQKIEYSRNRSSVVAFFLSLGAVITFTLFFSSKVNIAIGDNIYSPVWLLPITATLFAFVSWRALRKSYHFFILTLLGFTILYLVIGVLGFGWYIGEISALFLALGILSGISCGFNANGIVSEFINGAKDILSAALVLGLAAGIIIILQDGNVIDPLLNSLVNSLGASGEVSSLSAMYGIQTIINVFIPSATAKAAITIPIMAPFSDAIGISRQATVLAFQFGDGFTNMITPASGVLIAALGLARIPYVKWVKWAWKLIVALLIIGFVLLLPTIYLNLKGFC